MTLNGHQLSSGYEQSSSLDPNASQLTRNRRPVSGRPSPEVDVWYNAPINSASLHPSPHVSFPISGQNTPQLLSANNSPYFDAKSTPSIDGSPMSGKGYSPSPSMRSSPATMSWREAVADPRRRTHKRSQSTSVQRAVLGGSALVILSLLYLVFARGADPSPTIERISRQEHDKVAPREASSAVSRASRFCDVMLPREN